jgi:hypothetical protein
VHFSLKSGSLNLLELSGPVKACNGIALPYLPYHSTLYIASLNNLLSLPYGKICIFFYKIVTMAAYSIQKSATN